MRAYNWPDIWWAAFIEAVLLFRSQGPRGGRSGRCRSRTCKASQRFSGRNNEETSSSARPIVPRCYSKWAGRYCSPLGRDGRDVQADEPLDQFVPEQQKLAIPATDVELAVRVGAPHQVRHEGRDAFAGLLQDRLDYADHGVRTVLAHCGYSL